MSDNEQPVPSELELLKTRARMMGVVFSNNIGVEALRAKIAEKTGAEVKQAAETVQQAEQVNALEVTGQVAAAADTVMVDPTTQILPVAPVAEAPAPIVLAEDPAPVVEAAPAPKPKTQTLRSRMIAEQMRLIRCRITNMDPKKKDLPGEIFTVANRILGTVRKFVPYGELTDEGYHIPYIIYQQLKDREFLQVRTTKHPRTGAPQVHTKYVREFAIEVLPPLTEQELKDLAIAQTAAGSVD